MSKKFDLSKKAVKIDKNIMFFDTDIIEFIRRLKEEVKTNAFFHSRTSTRLKLYKIIEELAGDKLK